jgi:hypothetical protein
MMLVRNFDAWEVAIGIKASAPFRYDNLQAEGRFRPQAAAPLHDSLFYPIKSISLP